MFCLCQPHTRPPGSHIALKVDYSESMNINIVALTPESVEASCMVV